ncbi:hypothetical protein CapIbe_010757 [Capra ibex]
MFKLSVDLNVHKTSLSRLSVWMTCPLMKASFKEIIERYWKKAEIKSSGGWGSRRSKKRLAHINAGHLLLLWVIDDIKMRAS